MAYLQPRLDQPELAEEVCHDVLLVVWEQAAQFDPDSRFSTWLFGIARRLVWKAYRRAVTQAAPPSPAPDDQVDEEHPEVALCRQASRQAVTQAVAALPPVLRQTIRLRYYREYVYQDIAAQMACSEHAVARRLWQARRRLSASLRLIERSIPASGDADHRLSVTALTSD